jgi:hypothetical protein
MTRTRRVIRIIGPWRVSVSLVLGVVATLFVALWIALEPAWMPEFPYGEEVHAEERYYRGDPVPEHPGHFEVTFTWDMGDYTRTGSGVFNEETLEAQCRYSAYMKEGKRRPGWIGGLEEAREVYQSDGAIMFCEEAYGWPFRTLRLQYVVEDLQQHEFKCIRLPVWAYNRLRLGSVFFPTGIAMPGALLNTLLFASPVYLVLSVPSSQTRRYWRKKRVQCDACGYELAGLTGDLCPECGSPIDDGRRKRSSCRHRLLNIAVVGPPSVALGSAFVSRSAGSRMRNAAPLPSTASTRMRPWWSLTIRRVTARPSPVPLRPLVEWKGSKIQLILFLGMPGPLSITLISTIGRRSLRLARGPARGT